MIQSSGASNSIPTYFRSNLIKTFNPISNSKTCPVASSPSLTPQTLRVYAGGLGSRSLSRKATGELSRQLRDTGSGLGFRGLGKVCRGLHAVLGLGLGWGTALSQGPGSEILETRNPKALPTWTDYATSEVCSGQSRRPSLKIEDLSNIKR